MGLPITPLSEVLRFREYRDDCASAVPSESKC